MPDVCAKDEMPFVLQFCPWPAQIRGNPLASSEARGRRLGEFIGSKCALLLSEVSFPFVVGKR